MQKSLRFVLSHNHLLFVSRLILSGHCMQHLSILQDVKFPLMLDVYELCTAELQEKMLPIRSKFKEVEDMKLEKQQQKVTQIYSCFFFFAVYVLLCGYLV